MRSVRAIVLVAGRGERLRPLTAFMPKPLVPLAGKPLLGWTLSALDRCGIHKITLVTGYRGNRVQHYLRKEFSHLDVTFAHNAAYATTNTMCSVWTTRHAGRGSPLVLIDGDLVFDPALLHRFLKTRGNAVLCDARSRLDEEAVKAFGDGSGRVLRIGKTASGTATPLGESIGLAKFDSEGSRRLYEVCGRLLRSGGKRSYYEAAFQKMIDEGVTFHAVDVQGAKWVEIDTKADLRRARALLGASAKRAGSRSLPA